MTKQVTKRCHWVSQSYLRSFAADAAGQKIWRFSKNDGDPELKPIEKVAVRFHLYSPQGADGTRDDRVERKLGELERWFGHPIWKLLCTSEADLTWEPLRKMLALIVATTYVRNPAQFESWKRIHRRMVDEVSRLESMPTHVRIAGVDRKFDPSDWPEFRDADEEQMKVAWNDYVAAAGDIAPSLLKMRMVILAANKPVFVTSDNPVTITHPSLEFRGLGDPETTISFPISPTRMLVMDNRHNEPNGVYYSLADDSAASQNLLVWRNAIEHMFSHRHTDEVCAELLNAEDRLLVEQ
ncbi:MULTISPECIES: DUF4238 domain-containing protein [unclassified Brevundimonas]|uniref:DUF4238 domain-containing protein n=1 Tax=unclassified Brevundimonas TaxID=2622653 RepID=UPI003F8F33C1